MCVCLSSRLSLYGKNQPTSLFTLRTANQPQGRNVGAVQDCVESKADLCSCALYPRRDGPGFAGSAGATADANKPEIIAKMKAKTRTMADGTMINCRVSNKKKKFSRHSSIISTWLTLSRVLKGRIVGPDLSPGYRALRYQIEFKLNYFIIFFCT